MSTDTQVQELLPFLLHPSPQVVSLAVVNLLPFTVSSSPQRRLFLDEKAGPDNKGWLRVFAAAARSSNEPSIGKAALSALVNLTDSVTTATRVASLPGFVQWLFKTLTDTTSPLADEICMLLSNLSQLDEVCAACLRIDQTTSTDSPNGKAKQGVRSLQTLVDLFAKEGVNKHANYDYLAHVFANISASNDTGGREALLGMPESLEEGSVSPVPLSDLVMFTEHASAVRRSGVSSTLKNCAFVHEAHQLLLTSGKRVNFLPYILLPLCGPEEFDLDDMEKLPEEVQFLPPDKKRDPDPSTRLMLVETLILLCRTRSGRDALRDRGAYPVVKAAHLAEHDEQIQVEEERLVNLLMRDESAETKIEEVPVSTPVTSGLTSAQVSSTGVNEGVDEESIVQEV